MTFMDNTQFRTGWLSNEKVAIYGKNAFNKERKKILYEPLAPNIQMNK